MFIFRISPRSACTFSSFPTFLFGVLTCEIKGVSVAYSRSFAPSAPFFYLFRIMVTFRNRIAHPLSCFFNVSKLCRNLPNFSLQVLNLSLGISLRLFKIF